jgi:DNA-binding NarL/FixJ family response regulator
MKPESPPLLRHLALLFGLIALLVGLDLGLDVRGGARLYHVAAEALGATLALGGAIVLAREMRRAAREAQELGLALRDERRSSARWREEAERFQKGAEGAIAGLAVAIDREFERWQLSPAERAVGLLLLKGLSHKEVAELRGVSDRTVRQQARTLYAKAGLDGRADLAAYFLEDLLSPERPLATPPPSPAERPAD